jgi:hypothetical protein
MPETKITTPEPDAAKKPLNQTQWLQNGLAIGNARFIPSINSIHIADNDDDIIEIDLDECTSAIEALDWILHLSALPQLPMNGLEDFIECFSFVCERKGLTIYEAVGLNGGKK